MITIMFTDNNAYWGDATVNGRAERDDIPICTFWRGYAAQGTPGAAALAYIAVLDNAMGTHLSDISYDKVGENGAFNNFFDLWDDENATVEHFNSSSNLTGNANWTGSFIFSAGNQGSLKQIAPVITLRDSTITAIIQE